MILNRIREGILGQYTGIPSGLTNRVDKFTQGVLRGNYYLIGAESGVGKTTFADTAFVIEPFLWKLTNQGDKRNIKFLYFSLELSKEDKLFNWLSYLAYKKKGAVIDRNVIAGFSKIKLNEKEFDLIKDVNKDLDKLLEDTEFYQSLNGEGELYDILLDYAKANGKIIYKNKKIIDYKPYNPYEITIY